MAKFQSKIFSYYTLSHLKLEACENEIWETFFEKNDRLSLTDTREAAGAGAAPSRRLTANTTNPSTGHPLSFFLRRNVSFFSLLRYNKVSNCHSVRPGPRQTDGQCYTLAHNGSTCWWATKKGGIKTGLIVLRKKWGLFGGFNLRLVTVFPPSIDPASCQGNTRHQARQI